MTSLWFSDEEAESTYLSTINDFQTRFNYRKISVRMRELARFDRGTNGEGETFAESKAIMRSEFLLSRIFREKCV